MALRSRRAQAGAFDWSPAQSSSPDAWFRAAWNAHLEIRPYPDFYRVAAPYTPPIVFWAGCIRSGYSLTTCPPSLHPDPLCPSV